MKHLSCRLADRCSLFARVGVESPKDVCGNLESIVWKAAGFFEDARETRSNLDVSLTSKVTIVEQGMRDGALGLSTGLFYVPGTFTPTAEVIELAKVAGRYGGVHTSHQRDDASKVLDSVRETIAIGEGCGLPTQVTHNKVIGQGTGARASRYCADRPTVRSTRRWPGRHSRM